MLGSVLDDLGFVTRNAVPYALELFLSGRYALTRASSAASISPSISPVNRPVYHRTQITTCRSGGKIRGAHPIAGFQCDTQFDSEWHLRSYVTISPRYQSLDVWW